jgi:peptidoglycan/xylan/chitin deacetylase (PgdA/CDA1 family)
MGTIEPRATALAVLASVMVAGLAALAPAPASAADSAVVIMYHRFGEGRYPSTNTTIAQLEAHVRELASGRYNVLPLSEIVAALKAKRPLPERAVGISIDDGFVSIHREAWPRFRAAKLPFTLFTATDYHERPVAGYMTWDQIKEMAADPLVEIGAHSVTHPHMADRDAGAARAEIERSNATFRERLGKVPALFAYPFGESSLAVERAVRAAGYAAAFGQHSGAFDSGANMFYLPRFAFNETYGEISRVRMALNAIALPVGDVTPADPLVSSPNPPPVGFSLTRPIAGIERLSCYASHEGRARVERLGDSRIEVRFAQPLPKSRTRLNCTLPAGEGRWYWFGYQFYVSG